MAAAKSDAKIVVDLLELTLGQVDAIERELGVPFQKWRSDASRIGLVRAVAVHTGQLTAKDAEKLTVTELLARIDVDDMKALAAAKRIEPD